ncbi:hypothetical protein QBC34DRAFT_437048 [Podospora aff. communis PSN243]|uniref:Ubiquitin 3 binding protein But2 C-terminal domain-containing protein n=1 Tax=Podospora aff. communis PSN243 TaxID=3040156 RepID=A0AAV9GR18_9PEZI|nr:hypothetical protein QBC34DRAFT_437048 [Podospora aff. communis PSN243]
MRLFLATLAMAPLGLAAPSAVQSRDGTTQGAIVTFHANRGSAEAAIEVWNADQTVMLGQSCKATLDSGAFAAAPIAFVVDGDTGSGTVTIGAKTYTIHDNVAVSGGISCGRVTSEAEVMVKCNVPLPATLPLARMHKRDLADCFPVGGSGELEYVMRNLETEEEPIVDHDAPVTEPEPETLTATPTTLVPRQRVCEIVSLSTERVGNGNPHQNPKHIQLSIPFNCTTPGGDGRPCVLEHSQQTSYSIGWEASISGAGWITGGFSVQKEVSTGTTAGCTGIKGDYFAVWKKVGQTAYTVRQKRTPNCGLPVTYGPNYIIWSPNSGEANSNFYCVYGFNYVRNKGDRWLDTRANCPWGPERKCDM